ncbi:P-loop containing nucleoside triphosphate hydrolase protein [Chytridium lagenaria]|nr:P-loop containing nucleoside triphosphate hydrolase protein [Chytridium lagenaria]
MHRKKPFSAKQKKAQILSKRSRLRSQDDDTPSDDEPTPIPPTDEMVEKGKRSRHQPRHPGGVVATVVDVAGPAWREMTGKEMEKTVTKHKLVSVFAKLSKREMEEKKGESQKPFTRLSQESLEIGFEDLYPDSRTISFPKRPAWTSTTSKATLESQETASFNAWLDHTYSTWRAEELSFFEHNIEVWRQLWRVVEVSDVVLFVVDARHPVLHFPVMLYEWVVEEMGKKLVLVLNKCVCLITTFTSSIHPTFSIYPPEVHLQTLSTTRVKAGRVPRFTRSVGVATVLKACRDVDVVKGVKVDWDGMIAVEEERVRVWEERERRRREEEGRRGGRRRGRGKQFEEEEKPATSPTLKDIVTIGLVGHPNVGKSSLINGIMGKKVVSTSRTPGHTKHFQTIHINKTVRLCDCPGLVFPGVLPKPLQILSGMYKIAQVQEPYSSIQYLAERVPIEKILNLRPPEGASANYEWTAWDICEAFAIQRGFLTPRVARPDVYRAANLLLRMANDGRLLMCFRPPGFFAGGGKVVEGLERVRWEEEEEGDVEDEVEDDDDDEEEEEEVVRRVNAFALLDEDDDGDEDDDEDE